jgi:hypothetical protein
MQSHSPKPAPASRGSLRYGTLIVEWMEGAERRRGAVPEVFVNGCLVGPVDEQLPVAAGDYRIRVRRGRSQTREYDCTIHADQVLALEYESSEATQIHKGLMFSVACLAFGLIRLLLLVVLPDVDITDSGMNIPIGLAVFGAIFAADLWLAPHFPRGTLKVAQHEDALAQTTGGGATAVRDDCQPLHSGRLIVHLVVEPINLKAISLPPPRPNVIIDGKVIGRVADVLRVRPGQHRVRIQGWFEHSDELPVLVSPGELVELETYRTSSGWFGMVAVVIPGIAGIFFAFYLDMNEWVTAALIGSGLAASIGMLFVANWLGPTIDLEVKV